MSVIIRNTHFLSHRMAITFMAIVSFSIPLRSYSYGEETTVANIRDRVKAVEEWSQRVRGRMVLVFEDTKNEQWEHEKLAKVMANPSLSPMTRKAMVGRDSRLGESCHRKERRQYNFDMQARHQRIEIQDLRDLQAMVAAGNLPSDKTSLANADHTAIALQDWNHFDGRMFWTQYRPSFASMSLEVLKGRARSAYDPPLSAGILPRNYLELFKKDTTTIEEVDSNKKLKVKYAAQEYGSTEAILNPTDFRFQLLEQHDPQGQLYRRLQADDYHEAAGIRAG